MTITVNSLPVVSATATDTELCEGESATLTAIGAFTYVWTGNDNQSMFLITYNTGARVSVEKVVIVR